MVKHAAGRAETILRDHFGQRSTGAFTFVARSEPSAAAIVPALATVARRWQTALPPSAEEASPGAGSRAPRTGGVMLTPRPA
jgi:hypothetical protein